MSTYLSIFRRNILRLMDVKNINQAEVVNLTGVQQSVLSLFLTEKRGLNGENILRLQAHFGRASLDGIASESQSPPDPSSLQAATLKSPGVGDLAAGAERVCAENDVSGGDHRHLDDHAPGLGAAHGGM